MCVHFVVSQAYAVTPLYVLTVLKFKVLILEAPFKFVLNFDVSVVWWRSDGRINSHEYKSFEIYAVSIKISRWLNITTELTGWQIIYSNTAVYGEKWVWYFWSLAYFRFFKALNGAFKV